jgi:hypothetical protein
MTASDTPSLALHREIEQLAAEGHPQQALEDGLEALLCHLGPAILPQR